MNDLGPTPPTEAGPRRLKRSLRIGILYSRTGEFVPFVSVGLARDGGIFVSPVDIGGESWMQGPLIPGVPVDQQVGVSTSEERPKLHYHRSGVVRASLSGTKLDAATSQYEPIPNRAIGTMLSIVVTEPSMLPRQEFRKGDVATIEGDWPHTWTASIAVTQPGTRTAADDNDSADGPQDDLEPMRLVAQTPSQFVVDLHGYGLSLQILVDGTSGHTPAPGKADGPSITITAYPESHDGLKPSRAHALWNAGARNPLLGYQENFLWEADRGSWAYRSAYVGRFNRLPPWYSLSGTPAERLLVRAVQMVRRFQHGREKRKKAPSRGGSRLSDPRFQSESRHARPRARTYRR